MGRPAGYGGGIDDAGPLNTRFDTIVANATGAGGEAGGDGIEVCVSSHEAASVVASTIVGNTTSGTFSGSIEVDCGAFGMTSSTVAYNSESGASTLGPAINVDGAHSSLTEDDTIVADNGAANCATASSGTIASLGHNLSFPDTSCPHEVTGNPNLGPACDIGAFELTPVLTGASARGSASAWHV